MLRSVRSRKPSRLAASVRWLLAAVALGLAAGAAAQAVPPGFVASPDIYKVIAENDKYRVIQAVWQPGQKDLAHSHPDAAVYYLTDCLLRNEIVGVPPMTGTPKAGQARVQGPIASHTIENIGTTECRLIVFEPK